MSAAETTSRGPACPVCGRAAARQQHPFCSERCQKLDLAHWLGEAYVLPGSVPAEGLDTDSGGEEEIG